MDRRGWARRPCVRDPRNAFDPDLAAAAGRVQATLIGAGRLAVVDSGDADSTLLVLLAARALGHERVGLIRSPGLSSHPDTDELVDSLGLGVLLHEDPVRAAAWPPGSSFDSIACTDDVDRWSGPPAVRSVDAPRLLYPFAEAGLRRADIDACARALGLIVEVVEHVAVPGVPGEPETEAGA